ncbi:MAG: hypothetical protein OXU19_16180 [bacterium]|nr:hypothetical protein [bacterium]
MRRNGRARTRGWLRDASIHGLAKRVGARRGETVEACLADDFQVVPLDRFNDTFIHRARGILGIELSHGGTTERTAPTQMIASNRRFGRVLERFLKRSAIKRRDFERSGTVRAFSARQFLIPAGGEPEGMFRGSTLVSLPCRGAEELAAPLADGIGGWMLANLGERGEMPYKYWPSRGEESPADNAIRRFLATVALARLGEFRDSAELRAAAARNLRYNLARYFQPLGDGRGAIVESTGAKLGAAALGGLAILESPVRDEFRDELSMLAAGVNSLIHPKHGFRTFFFPAERDGQNWNFYSGEALLFWAEAMRQGAPFAPSLRRYTSVFRRCRDRHRRDRNPAFVPWHSQANASMFVQTGRREFADFVLEMNDALLPMQQWDDLPLDLQGRFYDPKHPEFGPPHAASTGAYLEGLADALNLARSRGDSARAAAYEKVIHRGLRSLRQLQFRSVLDTYYVSKKDRVLGALRTEAYDNAVRIDSAAHALAAAVKILRTLCIEDR